MGTDSSSMQRFYQVWHLSLGHVVGDGVVPRVGHTLSVDAEHSSGQGVKLTRTSLDVVLSVVLQK